MAQEEETKPKTFYVEDLDGNRVEYDASKMKKLYNEKAIRNRLKYTTNNEAEINDVITHINEVINELNTGNNKYYFTNYGNEDYNHTLVMNREPANDAGSQAWGRAVHYLFEFIDELTPVGGDEGDQSVVPVAPIKGTNDQGTVDPSQQGDDNSKIKGTNDQGTVDPSQQGDDNSKIKGTNSSVLNNDENYTDRSISLKKPKDFNENIYGNITDNEESILSQLKFILGLEISETEKDNISSSQLMCILDKGLSNSKNQQEKLEILNNYIYLLVNCYLYVNSNSNDDVRVLDSSSGLSYNKNDGILSWKAPAQSNKEGGVLKGDGGFRTSVDPLAPSDYLTTDIDLNDSKWLTPSNWGSFESDTANWESGYYDVNKIIQDLGEREWKDNEIFALNQLLGDEFKNLNWSDKIANQSGFKGWNEAFNKTGLNKYFGYDDKQEKGSYRHDLLGITTYSRHLLIEWMKGNAGKIGLQYDETNKQFSVPNDQGVTNNQGSQSLASGDDDDDGGGGGQEESASNPFDYKPDNPKYKKTSPWLTLGENILEPARLLLALRNNAKNRNKLNNGLRATIKNPYELYSPVNGDFASLQKAFDQAAQQRRAINPYTSDVDKQLAWQMQNENEARDIEWKGWMWYLNKLNTTADSARNLQQQNIKLRSSIANENAQTIDDVIEKRSMIDSGKTVADYNSIDNFVKQLGGGYVQFASAIKSKNDAWNDLQRQLAENDLDKAYKKYSSENYDYRTGDSNYTNAFYNILQGYYQNT